MTFELFTDAQGLWRWRLRAPNHRILAQSEAYTRRRNALHAIHAVQTSNAAEIHDLT